jgi:four helix bundle protein
MNDPKYLKLNNIEAYKIAFNLSNFVWKRVIKWDWFNKRTLGVQFVSSIDSISANIAEGFGRYHKKDKIKFYRYSQGSLKESFDWNEKSRIRSVLSKEEYSHVLSELKKLEPAVYRLINFTNEKLRK